MPLTRFVAAVTTALLLVTPGVAAFAQETVEEPPERSALEMLADVLGMLAVQLAEPAEDEAVVEAARGLLDEILDTVRFVVLMAGVEDGMDDDGGDGSGDDAADDSDTEGDDATEDGSGDDAADDSDTEGDDGTEDGTDDDAADDSDSEGDDGTEDGTDDEAADDSDTEGDNGAEDTTDDGDDEASEGHGQIVRTVAACAPRGKGVASVFTGLRNHGAFVSAAARGQTVEVEVPVVESVEGGDPVVTGSEVVTADLSTMEGAATLCDAVALIQQAADLRSSLGDGDEGSGDEDDGADDDGDDSDVDSGDVDDTAGATADESEAESSGRPGGVGPPPGAGKSR